ncbi:hypothetical protein BDV09DRAFT_187670 [Aspergillus tetrazonus]
MVRGYDCSPHYTVWTFGQKTKHTFSTRRAFFSDGQFRGFPIGLICHYDARCGPDSNLYDIPPASAYGERTRDSAKLASAVDLQCMNGGACPVALSALKTWDIIDSGTLYLYGNYLISGSVARYVLAASWFPNTPHSPGFLHSPVGLAR